MREEEGNSLGIWNKGHEGGIIDKNWNLEGVKEFREEYIYSVMRRKTGAWGEKNDRP